MKKAVVLTLFVALLIYGCHPAREACYAQAEAQASQEAFDKCPGAWTTCSERPVIRAELMERMAACP